MFAFDSAVRGYHYYRTFWQPEPNEVLDCAHEENNPYDVFAIKVCERKKGDIVGHLPMEISRPTKFLLDRGAILTATLTTTLYRASPIIQGGLEIPCKVEVCMPSNTIKDKAIVEKYKEMIDFLYRDPEDTTAIGSFLFPETSIVLKSKETRKMKKTREYKDAGKAGKDQYQDIRTLFKKQKVATPSSATQETTEVTNSAEEDVITLD